MKSQIHVIFSISLKFLLILSGLLFIGFSLWIISCSYDRFIELIIHFLNYPPEKATELKRDYLTPEKFTLLKYVLFIACLGISFSVYFLLRNFQWVSNVFTEFFESINDIARSCKNSFSYLSLIQKILFMGMISFILVCRVYYMITFPITNDEVFSWLYMVDKGMLVTSSYYPGPNNHIFYLQFCVIADKVLNDPVFIMRLPALAIGILTSILLFFYFLKRESYVFAWLITLTFSFAYNIFFYSFHGRGYVLNYLLYVVAILCLIEIFRKKQETPRIYHMLYVLSSVAGFYTLPSYLYGFLSMHIVFFILICIQRDGLLWKKFFLSSFAIIVLTCLVYAPVFLVSGVQSIVSNPWVQPLNFESFYNGLGSYLLTVIEYLFNFRNSEWVFLMLLIIGSVILFHNSHRKWLLLLISSLTVPLLILIIQKVHPFPRVWDYLLFWFSFLITVVMLKVLSLIRPRSLLVGTVALASLGIVFWSFKQLKETGYGYYTELESFMDEAYQREFTSVYVAEDTYQLFFQYNSRLRHKEVVLKGTLDNGLTDLIILPLSSCLSDDYLKKYELFAQNRFVRGYIKKTK